MTNLTKLDVDFVWTECCQESFEFLKETLIHLPILKYPDLNKPYTLFTDASKHAWACVLTQEYEYKNENKIYKVNHPITFQSGLFKESQLNWAALTKEAFAIYASVKKLSQYLEDADVMLKSDHLPLKKLLQKNTLNSKVNNWAIEISSYQIKFEYIKRIKDTLADTMSRLIQIDPEVSLEPEKKGYEFGYFTFDDMEPIKVQTIKINFIKIKSKKQPFESEENITLPITNEKLQELQREDPFCANIIRKLEQEKLISQNPYYMEGKVLQQYTEDNKQ